METEELQRIIEAILFAAGESVEASRLAAALEVDENEIRAAADALANRLAFDRRGIRVIRLEKAYQMVSSGYQDPGDPQAAQALGFPAGSADHHRLLSASHEGAGGTDPGCGQLLFRIGTAEQEAD